MRKSSLSLLGFLLVGCTTVSPLSHQGTLILKPEFTSGEYATKTAISPYTQSSIDHLVLKIFTYDGTEHDQNIQRSIPNAQLANSIVLSNLKANTTYRIKAYAYLDAAGTTQISVDGASSYTDVPLTNNDQPSVAALKVKLIDRDFNGQGTSSLTITNGGYSFSATESLAIPLIGGVLTFAGNSTCGATNGYRTAATFNHPRMLAMSPSGDLYAAEQGFRIRKIDSGGNVTIFAGSSNSGFTNAQGTAASFNYPYGITVDAAGNLYISDVNNNAIRRIDTAANVTTFAGNGTAGNVDGTGLNARFNVPLGLCIDSSGNLYVADMANHKIRKVSPAGGVTTLAGNGTAGFADGSGVAAQFTVPHGIAIDSAGNLYVADQGNQRVRKVTPAGVVTTLAGNGTVGKQNGTGVQATFDSPTGITVDVSGNVYVSDRNGNYIRKITPAGVVSTVAGNGTASSIDGTGSNASFNNPEGLAFDAYGNLYVGALSDNCIRQIH